MDSNWDLDALVCLGKCHKCKGVGHWKGICHIARKGLKTELYNYAKYIKRKYKDKQQHKRDTRHANVTQKDKNKQKEKGSSKAKDKSKAQAKPSAHANILQQDFNGQDDSHINMVQTSEQNEQLAQQHTQAHNSSSNINYSDQEEEDDDLNQALQQRFQNLRS